MQFWFDIILHAFCGDAFVDMHHGKYEGTTEKFEGTGSYEINTDDVKILLETI